MGTLQASIPGWVAMPSSRGSNPHLLCLLQWKVGSSPPASATWEAPSVRVLLNLTSLVRTHAFPICSKKEEHVFKGCSFTLQFTRKRYEDGLKVKSTRPHSGSWLTIQWPRGPAPPPAVTTEAMEVKLLLKCTCLCISLPLAVRSQAPRAWSSPADWLL